MGPVQRPDGSWLLDGLMHLDEVADLFGLPDPANEEREHIQTLGGLTMSELGRVPTPGDSVTWHGLRLEVLDMDGRRVDKVLATPRLRDAAETPG